MNNRQPMKKKENNIIQKLVLLQGLLLVSLCVISFAGCQVKIGGTPDATKILDPHSFVDDVGNVIETDVLPKTIVSLSSMHTENLYFLKKEGLIVGVDEGSNFPYEVVSKPHYDLNNDYALNKLIMSDPDLILITPDMNTASPQVISLLEAKCKRVVSLKPNALSEMDAYITKLGMLTGAEEQGLIALADYHKSLEEIESKVDTMLLAGEEKDRPMVFVEAAERGYETIYEGSPIDQALDLLKVDQIVDDNTQPYEGARTVAYGFEKLIEKGELIDHYFTLQGRSGDGTPVTAILQKEEMQAIKGIREGNLHELLVPLIDNYTLRYPIGVEGLAREIYGKAYLALENEPVVFDQALTRGMMVDILYNYYQLAPFTITDSTYYGVKKYHHVFGSFTDVPWQDPEFYKIEAVVMKAYIYPIKEAVGRDQEVIERFEKEKLVTRSEVAKFIHTVLELEKGQRSIHIEDIDGHPDAKIIQKVVDAGWMSLENQQFKPNETMKTEAFLSLLEKLEARGDHE